MTLPVPTPTAAAAVSLGLLLLSVAHLPLPLSQAHHEYIRHYFPVLMELCSLSAYSELQYMYGMPVRTPTGLIISLRSRVIFALNEYNKGKMKWHAHRIFHPSAKALAITDALNVFFFISSLCFSWFLMKPQDARLLIFFLVGIESSDTLKSRVS